MASVVVMATVDWEGDTLEAGDLQAMERLNSELLLFAKKIGQPIPLTHFICPAYFTRIDAKNTDGRKQEAAKIMKSGAIREGDEIGVHVHCWKSLALEAGIPLKAFQETPVGLVQKLPDMFWEGKFILDLGYMVPLGIYEQVNVERFLDKSKALLQEYLRVEVPLTSFRCGMWVTCDVVFELLAKTGFVNDASAVPFNYIKTAVEEGFGNHDNIDHWNMAIWGKEKSTGEPFTSNTLSLAKYPKGILGGLDSEISPPEIVNGILELPDTTMLIPWTNQALMCAHIDRAFKLAETSPQNIYTTIGFHQEHAKDNAFFGISGYGLSDAEKEGCLSGMLGTVVHAITKSKSTGIGVSFLTATEATNQIKGKK
jgi:hypothetical protein